MKVALVVLLAATGALAASAGWSGSQQPSGAGGSGCPSWCPSTGDPVCARDNRNNYYKFPNNCSMVKCGCDRSLALTPVRFTKCSGTSPGCPARLATAYDASDESGSDQARGAASSSASDGSDADSSSAPAASLEEAHLDRNQIRKKGREIDYTGYRY